MLRYQMVQRHIREMLGTADYAPGDRIPSERDLAERLGVNRLTVRRAVAELAQAGVLESNGTGGTRVARPRMVRPMETRPSVGMDRIIAQSGGVPSNRLVHFQIAPASAAVAERLRIPAGEEVVILRRVWSIDGRPFCIETSHLVSRLVPGLSADDLVAGQSLYALLRERYGIVTVNAERMIALAYVGEGDAKLLAMDVGAPALGLRLLVETEKGEAVEYTASINNPALVAFGTQGRRPAGEGGSMDLLVSARHDEPA